MHNLYPLFCFACNPISFLSYLRYARRDKGLPIRPAIIWTTREMFWDRNPDEFAKWADENLK